jgi:hypothetical protein
MSAGLLDFCAVWRSAALAAIAILTIESGAMAQDLPEAIRAPGAVALAAHAEGAQIYECAADQAGKLKWTFREPIASLIVDGKTVGRHSAGPQWELDDGSVVHGKVAGKSPGSGAADIAWLKLDASSHQGRGALSDVETIQRIHTHGGALDGECETAGAFRSVAYSADYIFLTK